MGCPPKSRSGGTKAGGAPSGPLFHISHLDTLIQRAASA